jgi:murein DD-endopeptidase MepM/ murein hydrolase activator NlpD
MNIRKKSVIIFRIFYLAVFLFLLIILLKSILAPETEVSAVQQSIVQPKENIFGFIDDSLHHYSEHVKRNETLSDILEAYHLRNTNVSELALLSKPTFDVRKIRAGKKYHLYNTKDNLNTLKYFVYEKDEVNFIVYSIGDSITVYTGQKEVNLFRNSSSVVIENSLFEDLLKNNLSIELAIELSKIFAWQIDFYHLQKGDNFKVIYEEEYIDSQMVGIGKVLGAYFNHRDKEYFAIPFMQDSVFQYFDENGNSLRKEFLKTPIEFARISSRYSSRRLHPVLKTYRPHRGVDYAAPTGTPIRTVGDGELINVSYSKANGKFVTIRHNSVYTTMYLHMSRFGKGIKKGTTVKQGQIIGYVGSTGLATGPHLHFVFYMNGSYVNPLRVEIPPSHPINNDLKKEYEIQKNLVIDELQKIIPPSAVSDIPPA